MFISSFVITSLESARDFMNFFFFFLVTRSLNGPARVHGATYLPWVGAITQHPAWAPCMPVPWLSSHPPELSSWVQAVMFFEVPSLRSHCCSLPGFIPNTEFLLCSYASLTVTPPSSKNHKMSKIGRMLGCVMDLTQVELQFGPKSGAGPQRTC